MSKRTFAIVALLALCLALTPSCRPKAAVQEQVDGTHTSAAVAAAGVDIGRFATAQRIVSFAPSLTETLYALGLGERVVGVSQYCVYPPEVKALPKVGGFLNPNVEMVVRLRADCVVLFANHDKVIKQLAQLGVPTLVVSGTTLEEVLATFATLGREFDCQERSDAMLADIHARMERIRTRCAGRPPLRVLTVIWRERGVGTLRGLQAASSDGYYSELLRLAGATALPQNTASKYPSLSVEGILELNPEVVFELVNDITVTSAADLAQVRADWQVLPDLAAVKNDRLYIITDDYATVPGPRFILLAEKLARYLHPDIDWDK